MHQIAILPLDDRPQTYGFAAPLAAVGGLKPLLPPRPLLGSFLTPGQPEPLATWLAEAAPQADAAVVAIDMLAYGGLIASRDAASGTPDQVRERLQVLRDLRKAHPRLPIYAASVLMRLSITAAGRDSFHWWKLIHRWSELDEPRTDAEREEKAQLEAEIPPHVLAAYQAARRRNHEVNRLAIDLVAEGVLDYLLISQEDCTERGPHRSEQAALIALADERGVADRVTLCPGADEGAHVLLARALGDLTGRQLRVQTVWSDPAGADRIAPFEDRPVMETLAGLLRAVGGRPAEGEADLTLYVHTPGPQAADMVRDAPPPRTDLGPFVAAIGADLAAGRPCAVADVAMANGGDPALFTALHKLPGAKEMAAYAAWNTCANTTGTVLAHAFLRLLGQDDPAGRETAHHRFLLERLVDDGYYQSVVRPPVNRWASLRGLNIWNLPEPMHREAESAVRALLEPLVRDLHRDLFGERPALADVQIDLAWPRTFEVTLNVEFAEVDP